MNTTPTITEADSELNNAIIANFCKASASGDKLQIELAAFANNLLTAAHREKAVAHAVEFLEDRCAALRAENAALVAQVAELQKDKEIVDWVERVRPDFYTDDLDPAEKSYSVFINGENSGDGGVTFREAVTAARKETP